MRQMITLNSMRIGGELINVFDVDYNDITYFFESQLATETSGQKDVHFHPVDPFSARFSVRWES
jgi:hypothetical protein